MNLEGRLLGLTQAALNAGKRLALANKESLVAGGPQPTDGIFDHWNGPCTMTAVAAWASVLAPSIDQRRAVPIDCAVGGPPDE